jgi:hypothetical protein
MSLPPAPTGMSPLRIVGLVLLAGVVLCGVVGSCLLVLALFLPAFQQ